MCQKRIRGWFIGGCRNGWIKYVLRNRGIVNKYY